MCVDFSVTKWLLFITKVRSINCWWSMSQCALILTWKLLYIRIPLIICWWTKKLKDITEGFCGVYDTAGLLVAWVSSQSKTQNPSKNGTWTDMNIAVQALLWTYPAKSVIFMIYQLFGCTYSYCGKDKLTREMQLEIREFHYYISIFWNNIGIAIIHFLY